MGKISDSELRTLLSCLELKQVDLAIEVLRGRITFYDILNENLQDHQTTYTFSNEQITEAALHAAMEEIDYEIQEIDLASMTQSPPTKEVH